MLGADVYQVLSLNNISRINHANTVVTSRSFLQLGGLASRGHVERHKLPQTTQYSDTIDKIFKIWNDIFTDSVDIHERVGGRNFYGPVLFVLDPQIMSNLPAQFEVLVTKTNPTKWKEGQSIQDRYFTTASELFLGFAKGTFDQMITFRTPDGILPFGQWLREIILDDPQAPRTDGSSVFNHALDSLREATVSSKIAAPIVRRTCKFGCKCIGQYASNRVLLNSFL
jgi:hypothetical protein